MKKRLIIAIICLLVGIVALGTILNYTFNPKPRVIAEETAAFSTTATAIQLEFSDSEQKASKKYLDQVVKISGEITAIETKSIILNNSVLINFLGDTLPDVQIGSVLLIKGRCVGFDELLMQVKVDQAQKLNK